MRANHQILPILPILSIITLHALIAAIALLTLIHHLWTKTSILQILSAAEKKYRIIISYLSYLER